MGQLDEDIMRLQAKLSEAKAKQIGLMSRAQTANARFAVREQLYDGRVDNAMARFDAIERNWMKWKAGLRLLTSARAAKPSPMKSPIWKPKATSKMNWPN